jgi:Crp-like helix-turn-helix domain
MECDFTFTQRLMRVAAALLPQQKITQIQLAAMVGSVKEVVARTIADFEALGALRRERGHVAYLNRQLLMDLTAVTNG